MSGILIYMPTSKSNFPLHNGDAVDETVALSSSAQAQGLLFREGHRAHLEALLGPGAAAPMSSAVDAALFQQLRGRGRR